MSSILKIYMWQIMSLITGFATLFIVIPFISSNPHLYGIYAVVISLTLFLTYADLGFLTAAVKYASEYVATGNRDGEVKTLGFATSVLLLFVLLMMLVVLVFAYQPNLLIKDLTDPVSSKVASNLLLIFCFSAPIIVLQRSVQLIYNIRLKDYVYQRVFTLFNLLKIAGSYFFFGESNYLLVEYFFFCQCLGLVSVAIAIFTAKRSFNYSLTFFLKSIRFSKEIYEKTKALAFTSLFVTISWIVFYELDLFVIGKFIGVKEVAIFSLALSLLTLFRSLHGIIYNPFTAKFNHFIGKADYQGLKNSFQKVLILGLPISIFPTLIVALSMDSFIHVWIGSEFDEVIPIVRVLLMIYLFNFIYSPASIVLIAYEKINSVYFINFIMPIVYWLGILLTYPSWGLMSFAIFKFIAIALAAIVYSVLVFKIFELDLRDFFLMKIVHVSVISLILFVVFYFTNQYLPDSKSYYNLLVYGIMCFLYLSLCVGLYLWFSKDVRSLVIEIGTGVFKRKR